MSGKITSRGIKATSRSKLYFAALVKALGAALFLFCTLSTAHATITWTGVVLPTPDLWTSNTYGHISTGTVTVNDGSELLSRYAFVGDSAGSTGTVTVIDSGSKWTNSLDLFVGYSGSGTLNIEAGGQVSNTTGYLGYNSGSTGMATVTGAGSKWTNSSDLYVGYSGSGTLMIEGGGQVSCVNGYFNEGAVTVTGSGSKWTNSGTFFFGNYGSATLNIEAGGELSDAHGWTGWSLSTITVAGMGSKWTNSESLDIQIGTLNVGNGVSSGGLVTAKTLYIGNQAYSWDCNINGGTLQAGAIVLDYGFVNFNWHDGTIRNYDAYTDVIIPTSGYFGKLTFNLAAGGTHTFNIDAARTGTVNAVMGDMTSGGSIGKTGAGTLLLTNANTYSGETVVEEGKLKVTGSILNTSGITVGEAGILDLAKTAGSATASTVAIDNDGMILISAGSQKVGAITGTGITHVNASATLTAHSIVQNTLSIGGSGAGFAQMNEAPTTSPVPEPTTLALFGISALGMIAYASRRRAVKEVAALSGSINENSP